MKNRFEIRLITEKDTSAVLEIYRPYVLNSVISFEYEVPSYQEYQERIHNVIAEYPWLVCLYDDEIIGFAYAGKHRYRTAYQWSPECTVYLAPKVHRQGIARILYEALFSILRLQGYFNVFAGVALPNEKSIGFHKALGFEEIGIFKKVGYKHGNWHDTQWFQLQLSAYIDQPHTPYRIDEIAVSETFLTILLSANEKANAIQKNAIEEALSA